MQRRTCGNCVYNDDLICDRKGIRVNDTDMRQCELWEGAKKHEDNRTAGISGEVRR